MNVICQGCGVIQDHKQMKGSLKLPFCKKCYAQKFKDDKAYAEALLKI